MTWDPDQYCRDKSIAYHNALNGLGPNYGSQGSIDGSVAGLQAKAEREAAQTRAKAWKPSPPPVSYFPSTQHQPTPVAPFIPRATSESSATVPVHYSRGSATQPFVWHAGRFLTAPFRWALALVSWLFRVGLWFVKAAALLSAIAVGLYLLTQGSTSGAGRSAVISQPPQPLPAPTDRALLSGDAVSPTAEAHERGLAAEPGVRPTTAAWVGVAAGDLDPEEAATAGLPGGTGAVIRKLVENGPAATSNLAVDDVILAIAGERIRSQSDVPRVIRTQPVGQPIVFVVRRAGVKLKVRVTPIAAPQ